MRMLVIGFLVASCGRTELARFEPVVAAEAGIDGGTDAGVCKPGFVPFGDTCIEVAGRLDGLRWELPCSTIDPMFPDYICTSVSDVNLTQRLSGVPGALYDVRVRVRGVVETRAYTGGTTIAPFVMKGGTSRASPESSDAWNIYRLDVSSPAEHWFLNVGESDEYFCHLVDATFTIRAQSKATVVLFASTVDGRRSLIRNRGADGGVLVAPEVPPAPASFDGQFLQLDVLSVTLVP